VAKKSDIRVKQINNIERLEVMEEKFGVRFEGLNATYELSNIEKYEVHVYGEMQALNGSGIAEDLRICATIYSSDGTVLGVGSDTVLTDDFFALCPVFVIAYIGLHHEPVKVRIYPTKR